MSSPTVPDTACSHNVFTCASDQCASCGDVCAPCFAKVLALSTANVVFIGSTEAWTPGWSISGEDEFVSSTARLVLPLLGLHRFLCLLTCILHCAFLTWRLLSVQGFGLASCIVGFGAIRFVVIPCMVKVGLGSGRLTALYSAHRSKCPFL